MQQSNLMRGAARPALAIQHHPVLLLARAWQPGLLLLISAVLVVIFASAPAGMAVSGLWMILVGGLFLAGAVWMAFAYLELEQRSALPHHHTPDRSLRRGGTQRGAA